MNETIEISRAPIDLSPVESSQIHSIGHDASTKTLAICFKDKAGGAGSVYHYANVTEAEFAAFKGAESIGSHFYKTFKHAKDKYPYAKIEKEPTQS
nr:hypothetical protein HUO10_003280 [Paraburkholderia busanensis]